MSHTPLCDALYRSHLPNLARAKLIPRAWKPEIWQMEGILEFEDGATSMSKRPFFGCSNPRLPAVSPSGRLVVASGASPWNRDPSPLVFFFLSPRSGRSTWPTRVNRPLRGSVKKRNTTTIRKWPSPFPRACARGYYQAPAARASKKKRKLRPSYSLMRRRR